MQLFPFVEAGIVEVEGRSCNVAFGFAVMCVGTKTEMVRIETSFYNFSFTAFSAVNIKTVVFWDVTRCNAVDRYRRFGGTCRLRALACGWRQ
jgi:hypothetical protein